MTDLLDLLDDLDHDPADVLVHAIRPNMWAPCGWCSCGWCSCGCEGHRHATYHLRQNRTGGITCKPCITEMETNPWPA